MAFRETTPHIIQPVDADVRVAYNIYIYIYKTKGLKWNRQPWKCLDLINDLRRVVLCVGVTIIIIIIIIQTARCSKFCGTASIMNNITRGKKKTYL